MKHRMRDGSEIEIRDMSDSHLLNTIALLQRKADSGVVFQYGGGVGAEDMWYDEEVLTGKEALEALNFGLYVGEAKRRGLKIPNS